MGSALGGLPVYRKVQTLGLSQRYVNDESSRVCIRKLLALAFVPKVNIPQTFDILKANCPEELLFENKKLRYNFNRKPQLA